MNLKRIFFICLLGIFLIPHPSWAKFGRLGFHDHLNVLKESFDRNNVSEALENLWLALIDDPYDQDVRAYLHRALGLSLSAPDRSHVMLTQDFLGQIQNLTQRKKYYTDKNEDLSQLLLKSGVERSDLNGYADQLKNISDGTSAVLEVSTQTESTWDRLYVMLNQEKILLEAEVGQLERQYQGLTRFHQHRVVSSQPVISTVIVASDAQLTSNMKMHGEKAVIPSEANSDWENLGNLVNDLQRQIAVLHNDLQQKNQMINDLRVQVVDLSLNLAQRDKTLNDRIGELSDVRKRMDDVQARFDLGQKIIQEKDVQLDAMQKELVFVREQNQDLQQDMKVRLEEKDQRIKEMAGMLDVYWKKLNAAYDSVDQRNDDVKFLLERLLTFQDHLEEKDIALQKTHEDLDDFEQRLSAMRNRASNAGQNVASSDVLDMEMKLRNVKNYLVNQIEENDQLSRYLVEQKEQIGVSLQQP